MIDNNIFDNNSLSRLIAEKITEEIITGKLKAGDKLIEANYAEEFGTSRAPIREAFYLLAIDGLVERIPRKGSVVKGYSERDIIDLLEIRMMLESLAIERIAELDTPESSLKHMEQLVNKMELVDGDRLEYAMLNQKFHLGIIEMSKSDIIANMYSRLGLPLLSLQRLSFEWVENINNSLKEHHIILNHLHKKQYVEAKKVLMKHNQNVFNPKGKSQPSSKGFNN
ncbi:GntR family transcriptional regulator [Peribacillus sp. NPDC060186]